jgi:5-formyltetrahydrofolate cyclo-ligase
MNKAQKSELRQALKAARLELTTAEYTVKSRALCENLKQATDWSQVKTLHYFEPMHQLLEPDTSDLITYLEDTFPKMHLATSRKVGDSWEVIGVRGDQPADDFDVIIVPMLGFDKALHRIGYGGGYYDRFLATQPSAKTIGVCFEQGKLEHIPTEPHDITLKQIITDTTL